MSIVSDNLGSMKLHRKFQNIIGVNCQKGQSLFFDVKNPAVPFFYRETFLWDKHFPRIWHLNC